VFRAWFAGQNPGGAAQLAAVLVISAALLLALERRARGSRRFSGGSSRWRALHPIPLPGLAGWIACGFCAGLTILGAVLPFGYLLHLALGVEGGVDWAGLMPAAADTLMLGTMGGLVTFLAAGLVALAAARGGRVGQVGLGAASLGYAAPGAVLAVGLLSLYGLARQAGLVAGLGAGLGLMLLMWAYAARFTAAGAQPVAAGLERVTPHMTGAARTLGVGFWQRSWRLDMPLAAPSLLAAALIVFSEIVRELPATLILRPFGVETLATRAHALAADERLAHAAAPALLIVAIGIIPIVLLVAGMGRARAGAQ
jgi:iron(III) transport system permease protein